MLTLDLSETKTKTRTGVVQRNHEVGSTFSILRNQHTNFHSDQIKFTLSSLGYRDFCVRIFLKNRTDTMCACVHVHVCKCTCVYIYIYVHIHTCVYIYIHVCIYIHVRTYMCVCVDSRCCKADNQHQPLVTISFGPHPLGTSCLPVCWWRPFWLEWNQFSV